MTHSSALRRAPAASLGRINALADPERLRFLLGPIACVRRERIPSVGFSSSLHEWLIVERPDGSKLRLRLKRTHVGEDWIAQRLGDVPPGREVRLLSEPSLDDVWTSFERAYLAFAVEGSEAGLLMEDHTDNLLPDRREPISIETEDSLLNAIASLHARFWSSPALGLPWLARPQSYCDMIDPRQAEDTAALEGAPESIREGVRRGWREALHLLPHRVAMKLTLPAERLWREWEDLPRTLVHGDVKVANFAFLPGGKVAAFDWTGVGAAPATVDLGWYLAVNSTRLARSKDELIASYRARLEPKLGLALNEEVWERMVEAGVVSGALMLLWSKALSLQEGSSSRRDDWSWWVARLTTWSAR